MKSNKYFSIVLYILVLLLVTSCSTKKNSFARRSYHNLTSHYNGYWNARENMNEALLEIQKNSSDNFTTTLTVNFYGNQKEAQSLKPSMDKSIEKAFIMVRRHSMMFEGEEKVKWIDDCYLLIGQCYFYEKDYSNARRTFQYVIDNYPTSPTKYSALLWIAMTYTQNKEYEKAAIIFESLRKSVDNFETTTEVRKQLPIAYADFFILQSKEQEAITHLETALLLNKSSRKLKQRLNFILGQIYQKQEQYPDALTHFKKSSSGSDFDIVFNSKIRMAQCADVDNTASVVKILQKMLKEEKNKNYKDQIYYALAQIAKRGGDTANLITNLEMSVSTSVSNDYQKAISSYELADLFFLREEYILSRPYYDTTVQYLPQDYKNFVEIKQKTSILGELVDNLLIVQQEDSLQRLARMDEDDRMIIIDSIIEGIKEQERIDKELEMQRQRNYSSSVMNEYENQQTQNRLGTNVSWYFYSPQTVSSGINDFKKKWGDRKLEDLWALKEKQTLSWDDLGEVDTTAVDTTQLVVDEKNPQFYLQNLPLTEEKMEASNIKIEEALYMAGFIAMDQLSDYRLSNECFMELVKRYPETEHKLTSYIMMYLNCKETGDEICMDDVGNIIITEYPDSDFAKLLKDPAYLVVMTDKLEASKQLYKDTYDAMSDKLYDIVSLYSEEGLSLDDKKFSSRFLYLSALSELAANGEQDSSAIAKLQKVVKDFPNDEITPVAQDLLSFIMPKETVVLDSATIALMEEEQQKVELLKQEISQYKFVCNAPYFYVLLVDSKKANPKAIATRASDYIMRYYKLENLTSVERVFNDDYEMITISVFSDCNKALDFYDNTIVNNYIFSSLTQDAFYHFIISQENYPVFYKSKNIEAYIYFFKDKLLSIRDENK